MTEPCCTPRGPGHGAGRERSAPADTAPAATVAGTAPDDGGPRHRVEQASVPAQAFAMGDAHGDGKPSDGEGPVHHVTLESFEIDTTPVTNGDFARFVAATGHRTEAEDFGFSAVFHLAVAAERSDVMGPAAGTPWWYGVRGADWARPHGPRSDLDGLDDHPVVHISWNDARAYCAWAGRRLPTEAEWECASRGGIRGARYPWGDDLGERWACNIWQGRFPTHNTTEDGYLTTAPVRSYRPNGYGLWQTVGNVWEWCADWWDPGYYRRSPRHSPTGPKRGESRVLRGGSYLCHDSYCNRYRNAARSANTPDSSMGNAGFRTVARR